MKTLIVYYSLEGNTDYTATRIANRLGADKLRLRPVKEFTGTGLKKFFWGGKSAMMAEKPKLEDYDVNLAKYDRIIIGFPVWASNIAPPIRTFVEEHKAQLKRKQLAAFACQAGGGADKALQKLKAFIGIDAFELEAAFKDPKKKQSGETDKLIDGFCDILVKQDEIAEEELAQEWGTDLRGLRKYLTNWNYKKHVKLCAAIYVPLIAFDLTVSYFICKKIIDKLDEAER